MTVLQQKFHLLSFRSNQQTICESILNGRSVLAILPTGGGKSLCYQLPAVCLPGLTIVISPLLSLINDQVTKLQKLHISAAALTSQQTRENKNLILSLIARNQLKLLYLSPEQLQNKKLQPIWDQCEISCVVVDEAHCIAEWGNDFRPAYLQVNNFIKKLKNQPTIAAFTATATQSTINTIIAALNLKNTLLIKQTAVRKNLTISIIRCQSTQEKLLLLTNYITIQKNLPAIIYCATRGDTEHIAEWLKEKANIFSHRLVVKISAYHAGLDKALRQKIEADFLSNQIEILVATTAFGMGVDKPNTRTVVHWQIPNSIENFCQEIGRAGRDQLPAQSFLLYYHHDLTIHQTLLTHVGAIPDLAVKQKKNKLFSITQLAKSNHCLNRQIVDYFGERHASIQCNRCSNCLNQELLSAENYKQYQLLLVMRKQKGLTLTKGILLWLAILRPQTSLQIRHVPGVGMGLLQSIQKLLRTHCP